MTPPFERRRAEDVFRVVEEDIFPHLGAIDTKIDNLERGVQKLAVEGCVHRAGDLHRTEVVESSIGRIFEKIDGFGSALVSHQIATEKHIGSIKTWVLSGCIVVLISLLAFFAKDYANDIERGLKRRPAITSIDK